LLPSARQEYLYPVDPLTAFAGPAAPTKRPCTADAPMKRRPKVFDVLSLLALSLCADGAATEDTLNHCFDWPSIPAPFDSIDKNVLEASLPGLHYVTNPEHLAFNIADGDQMPSLQQRLVPSSKGSERVVASIVIEKTSVLTIEQSVFFEPPFDWGDTAIGGKIGFGIAGGSAPTGGSTRTDGFSARFVWGGSVTSAPSSAPQLGVYLYSADRSQNLPYGDFFEVPGIRIPEGRWFDISMTLKVNSDKARADGSITVSVDGQRTYYRDGIHWQSSGNLPSVDKVLYASFHGGNTSAWSPATTQHLRIKDVCVRQY